MCALKYCKAAAQVGQAMVGMLGMLSLLDTTWFWFGRDFIP